MLALSEHSVSVKGLYSAEGKSLGMAIVHVSNGSDAEKVRNHCSGQIIDAGMFSVGLSICSYLTLIAYRLTVQHVLPPTQPLPPQTVEPFAPGLQRTTSAPAQPKAQAPPARTPKGPKAAGTPGSAASNGRNDKPPGLQLLQRMNKPGTPGAREKQAQYVTSLHLKMLSEES
jgi:hypothetical protein